ncbi:hypothetical protein BDW74DRAFT_171287 [Aspergillus multicolor]|uniref:putative GPI-anchored cell surface glycoprotein n=1 Tax=Aspergillus multicolor TaxID=41759 RepID=UPI003CCCAA1E
MTIHLFTAFTVVGRASVSRELGSPAALPDLTLRSRRSSSRASQRTAPAPAPELSTSHLTQSSYSLPPTPLTSTFDDILPSAKRRRTQRAINSEDKTLPSSVTDTPTHRAFSEPFQASKSHSSARTTRASNLAQSSTQSTPSRSSSKPPASEKAQSRQQSERTATPKPQTRQQNTTVEAESEKDIAKDSAMGGAISQGPQTRRMSTRLDGPVDQENAATPAKPTASRDSSPQSSRRDRNKPSPAAKAHTTPISTNKAKPQENGTAAVATPAKQPETTTPVTATRSRRRDRKSTKTNETPSSKQTSSTTTKDKNAEQNQSRSPNKRSNTVTLNQAAPNGDANGIEVPADVENGDYHFDYDSEMYRNNFGLDGHMDAPTSPTSLSTTTSNAAPLESQESERRHRRTRAPSVKATAESTGASPKSKTNEQPAQQMPAPTSTPPPTSKIMIFAKHIYAFAAEAAAPGFVSPPEVDAWIKELQQKVDAQKKEKQKEKEPELEPQEVAIPSAEEEAESGRESTPPSSKPYSDNVQATKPWTDDDGWHHTGQVNKHEEEFVMIPPTYEWFRPNHTYGDNRLMPPVRVRSLVQAEKDRAMGYPPRIGDRNVPRSREFFLLENVPEEKAIMKLREEARARGIWVSRFMSAQNIQTMIDRYDAGKPPVPLAEPEEEEEEPVTPAVTEPSRKRQRPEDTSGPNQPESADTPRAKRQRPATSTDTSAAGSDAERDPNKPTLNLKFKFKTKKSLFRQCIANLEAKTTAQSKKRPHSEIEDTTTTQSPRIQKQQKTSNASSTPAKATDASNTQTTPGSATTPTETTPGGRPRRRATEGLMAGFQRHAEERALRSERAKMGHARRKGTPLKTVTGVHGDTLETPSRPVGNPMNIANLTHKH